ncbi:Transcriptional regulatory protein DegU [Pirellula sp. SH-Sr6A]|uniref:response regulator n=1 Tax=Pirellula sp. SH-Sr6A TaxID=1632865 RepID=UPI00078C2D66|nr:response regulator transcription factor [Pirellula sp. SH-Sr6A]AMV32449.1 Transcriptional regulatory protein DegU [Pirellula sp. SH-Sr6A]
MKKTRILIADDHAILAEGLRRVLEPEFEVVGLVSNGEDLVSAANQLSPDVIITDITMPVMNGIDAATQLRSQGNSSKLIFLTMHRDVAYARRAMEAGAVGYLLKHSVSAELTTAISVVLQGRTYMTPMIAGELLESYRGADQSAGKTAKRLTTRQREVLQLVAEGRSAKEVARALGISVRTAEAHKAKILETLELGNTTELVQYAIRNGIISSEW